MKIALVQQNIIWGEPKANWDHLDELLQGLPKVDLVVLPEMFSTGFITGNPERAEKSPAPSAVWMQNKARELDCAIAGSIAVCENGKNYNRFHFVKPDGEVTTYDKRHLFKYGGEGKTFTAGDKRAVVEWRGIKMLLAVCYDIRFPVWLRNKGDYDGILLVANWPDVRRLAWDTLKCARAIENQCFMAAVNRCGTDPVCNYDGGTAFINPYGEITAKAADNKEEVIIADFDLDKLNEYRAKFPVTDDADIFELR